MNHFASTLSLAIITITAFACSSTTSPTGTGDGGGGAVTDAATDAYEGGGGGGQPDAGTDAATCSAHPMSGNPACDTCGQTQCPTEFAACFSGGACAAYVACFCACSNQACVAQCGSKIDATCASCVATLTACQKSSCGGVCP